MRIAPAASVLVLACATAVSAAEEGAASKFLAEAREKYADPRRQDLGSFSAEIALRSSADPKVMAARNKVRFAYSWTAPDGEDFAMMEVPEAFQKPLRQSFQGIWRDMLTAPVIDKIASGAKIEMSESGADVLVSGQHPEWKRFTAVFDKGSKKLLRIELGDRDASGRYGFREEKGLFRLWWKDTIAGGQRTLKITLEGVRAVNTYLLPCIVAFEDREGKRTLFNVKYATVNGKPASAGEADPEAVKAQVEEFRKGWKSWDELEKIGRMKDLALLDHDLASVAIASLGLSDQSATVRRQAADSLGEMGRSNVVPQLIAAMKPNEEHVETYLAVIRSLGLIGDPRAIPLLSKDWWNQHERDSAYSAARAKIDALGDIRDRRSVDAILDLFYIAPDEALGPVGANILNSLRKLTGQDFDRNRRAWKDWWKKNRETFKFE